MLIPDYTTYDDIRAALGVSSDELEDATLGLHLYEDALLADLEDVALAVPPTYIVVKALASPDQHQERFLQCARVFAVYSVAKQLTISLSLFSPVKVGDGKAEMGRVSDPHRETVRMVNQEFDKWRNRLIKAFEAMGSAASSNTPRVYFGIISPDFDPVTNE